MDSINKAYAAVREDVEELYAQEGVVLLNEILDEKAKQGMREALDKLTFEERYVPDLHRYEEAKATEEIRKHLVAIATFMGKTVTKINVRRFSAGSYTLQHGDEPYEGEELLYFMTQGWGSGNRGEITYADDQPLFIQPQDNTAALVRRGSEVRRFVKRVTYHANKQRFILVSAITE